MKTPAAVGRRRRDAFLFPTSDSRVLAGVAAEAGAETAESTSAEAGVVAEASASRGGGGGGDGQSPRHPYVLWVRPAQLRRRRLRRRPR